MCDLHRFLVAHLPPPPTDAPFLSAAEAIAVHPGPRGGGFGDDMSDTLSTRIAASAPCGKVSPWGLFSAPKLQEKLNAAAQKLLYDTENDANCGRGSISVVDGLLGPDASAAVAADFRQFVGELAEQQAFVAGQVLQCWRVASALSLYLKCLVVFSVPVGCNRSV